MSRRQEIQSRSCRRSPLRDPFKQLVWTEAVMMHACMHAYICTLAGLVGSISILGKDTRP